jgi:hypothetical protein
MSISPENKANLSQYDSYNLLLGAVERFSFIDSLRLDKRRELVNLCVSTLEGIEQNPTLTQDKIEKIKELAKLGIDKAQGNALSNFFMTILFKDYKSFTSLLKELNKLLKIDAPAAIIATINNQLHKPQFKSSNLASSILFSQHIYEKMLYYGHRLTEKEGQPLFRYTKREPFFVLSLEDFDIKVKEIFDNKELVIEFKSNSDQGGFERIKINDEKLTEAELKLILQSHNDVEIIYPTQQLTLSELFANDILIKNDNDYSLSDRFLYLDEGFVSRSQSEWYKLKPTNHITNPPKEHKLEVVVYSEQDMPGIFLDQGHASVKLTTPNGEVYEVGFYPDPSIEMEMKFDKGVLYCPDPMTYVPTHKLNKRTLTYTLTPHAFKEVIKKIEIIQRGKKDDLAYHPFLKNCSAFARDIRDTALEHGAKNDVLSEKKFSYLEKAHFNTLEQVAAFTALNLLNKSNKKGVSEHKFEQLKSDGFYLPINLLFNRSLNT